MTAIFLLCPGHLDSVIWTCPARVYPIPFHSLSGREERFLSGVPTLIDYWCFLEHRVDRGSEITEGSVL